MTVQAPAPSIGPEAYGSAHEGPEASAVAPASSHGAVSTAPAPPIEAPLSRPGGHAPGGDVPSGDALFGEPQDLFERTPLIVSGVLVGAATTGAVTTTGSLTAGGGLGAVAGGGALAAAPAVLTAAAVTAIGVGGYMAWRNRDEIGDAFNARIREPLNARIREPLGFIPEGSAELHEALTGRTPQGLRKDLPHGDGLIGPPHTGHAAPRGGVNEGLDRSIFTRPLEDPGIEDGIRDAGSGGFDLHAPGLDPVLAMNAQDWGFDPAALNGIPPAVAHLEELYASGTARGSRQSVDTDQLSNEAYRIRGEHLERVQELSSGSIEIDPADYHASFKRTEEDGFAPEMARTLGVARELHGAALAEILLETRIDVFDKTELPVASISSVVDTMHELFPHITPSVKNASKIDGHDVRHAIWLLQDGTIVRLKYGVADGAFALDARTDDYGSGPSVSVGALPRREDGTIVKSGRELFKYDAQGEPRPARRSDMDMHGIRRDHGYDPGDALMRRYMQDVHGGLLPK